MKQVTIKSTIFWWCLLYDILWILVLSSSGGAALPSKFIAEVVTDVRAIKGTFATNPRNENKAMLLLVSKEGQVYALEDPDNSPVSSVILDLSDKMCTNEERGLQSIVIDPQFDDNKYVYLYYSKRVGDCTPNYSPYNVIDRFTMNVTTIQLDLNTQTEIWR
jgi:hypothetical protein